MKQGRSCGTAGGDGHGQRIQRQRLQRQRLGRLLSDQTTIHLGTGECIGNEVTRLVAAFVCMSRSSPASRYRYGHRDGQRRGEKPARKTRNKAIPREIPTVHCCRRGPFSTKWKTKPPSLFPQQPHSPPPAPRGAAAAFLLMMLKGSLGPSSWLIVSGCSVAKCSVEVFVDRVVPSFLHTVAAHSIIHTFLPWLLASLFPLVQFSIPANETSPT